MIFNLRRKQRGEAFPGVVLHELVDLADAVLHVDAFEFEPIDEKLRDGFMFVLSALKVEEGRAKFE